MKLTFYTLLALPIFISLFIACEPINENVDQENTGDLCNELAGSKYLPTTINNILALARDTLDIMYVIDKVEYQKRAFISNKDTLYRTKVNGSSIIGERYYFLSIEGGDQLIFQNEAENWSDFYHCRESKCEECDSILSSKIDRNSKSEYEEKMDEGWQLMCNYLDSARPDCQALTIAEKIDVQTFAIKNYPPTTRIEYLASLQDSNYLIISRNEYDWDGDVVIHYGKPGDIKLRELLSFLRARDGGSTWIKFMIDSQEVEAYFGIKWDSSGFGPGSSHLAISEDTLQLERLDPSDGSLAELGFNCMHEIR